VIENPRFAEDDTGFETNLVTTIELEKQAFTG
jgi:hypothetical protein